MEAMAAAIGSAFLDSAIDLLVKKLDSPQVFTFFKSQKLDKSLLEKLKVTLNTLNGLRLADTERMQIFETTVKIWHDDVTDAVYEAEDLLNEIGFEARRSEFNAARCNSKTGTGQVRNLIKKLNRFNNKKGQKGIVGNLGKICDKLELLERKARTLQLMRSTGEIGSPSLPSLPTTSVLELSHVYGRDDVKRNVIESLLSDEARDKELEVIPIVGRAGIGKTTLAKFVYNDSQVQDWFNLKAWVYVSQKFDVIKLTKDILKAADVLNCDSMTGDQLHSELRNKLVGKKLLLVLDDVWSGDQLTWDFLLAPLKSAAHGSKILVTVRDRSVASAVQSAQTHILQEISGDDCWLLFAELAFSGANVNAYSQFEERFRGEIIRRCNGLPLTARLLGGLLKSKRDAGDWTEILNSNIWDLRHGNNLPVLNVSYYFLPLYLRTCFAYCGIFPKGYLFKKEELVLLWLIEGFLVHRAGYKEMKEEGYKYFHELVSRSFFEQASDHSTCFIMHDLTRELAKFVSGEFSVCLDDDGDSRNISGRTRHLSYARTRIEDLSNLVRIENLRTFLSTSKFFLGGMNNEGIHTWSSRFKHLRVLSLPKVHEVPDLIGSLKRLCYLNLSGTSTQRLPESLCTLHDLQILILHGCNNLIELPTKMMKLTNLHHLDIKGARLQQMPPQMGKLTKLQVLTDFFVGRQNGCSIKELGELKCLKGKLRIWNLQNVDDARDALGGTRDIEMLDLRWSADTGDEQRDQVVLDQLQPHAPLFRLAIVGYGGKKFPAWLLDSSISNIVDLRLSDCNNCSTMPPLGQLASLNKLLIRAFDGVTAVGREFYGRDTSAKTPFKSLQTLTFEKMSQWREWVPYVEGGAFPHLQVLCIRECPELKKVLPSHLPSLIELKITECAELVLSLPKSPAIEKMTLRDHLRRVELERFPSGLHSLAVDSFCSFDSLLKELEQLGCFPSTLKEMNIESVLLTCLPLKFFPKLEKLDIRGCRTLESLCAQEEPSCPSTSTTSLKVCECPKLEELSLSDCSKLKTANCFLPSLVKLAISYCGELEAFPGVGLSSSSEVGFSSKLESLEVHDCNTLFALRKQWDFDKLFSVQNFQVFGLQGS